MFEVKSLLYKLDVNTTFYQHFTDRKDEEIEGFDELSQLRTTIEKNRKKRKSFQNKRVR